MSRIVRFAVVFLAAVMTACGQPTPKPQTLPTRVVDATDRASIPYMREGRDYRVTGIYGAFGHGYDFVSYGSVRKGVEFGVLIPGQDQHDLAEMRSWTSVALVELDAGRVPSLDSGKVTILKHPDAPEREGQVGGVTRSGDQLVWLTDAGYGQCIGCEWELYAANLKTSRVRHLASHREVDDPGPSVTASDSPQIVGGRIYLTVSHPSGLTARAPSVYSVPLDGDGKLRRVIPGASAVFADGRYVRFVNRDGQLLRWDPKTRETSRAGVAPVRKPESAFFHEGVAVQADGPRVVITEVGEAKTIIRMGSDDFGYLNATSRWVGVTAGRASMVYDLKRRKLFRLKDANASPTQPYDGNHLDINTTRFDRVDQLGQSIALLPD